MEWIQSLNPETFVTALAVAMALIAVGLIAFVLWTSRVEHNRVRRYVEARGGTVLSVRRVNRFTPDVADDCAAHLPWQLDPVTPRFQVHWRDRSGREHVDTFVTKYLRRSVWTAEPLADGPDLPADVAALVEENHRLRAEVARRGAERRRDPCDQAGNAWSGSGRNR